MSVIDDITAGTWPALDDAAIDSGLAPFDASSGGIINIPGFPPFLGQVGDGLGAAINFAFILEWLTAEFAPVPWLNIVLFIVDIILLLVSFFVGRPREEATLNCAQNLIKAQNSAAYIAGNNILRIFKEWNVVISESGPGEHLVAAIVAQFVNNLTGQGIPIANARQIVLYQFTFGADHLGKIHPFLNQRADPTTPAFGPQGFERIFKLMVDQLEKRGIPLEKAQEEALKLMLQYGPLRWLFRLYLGHQPGDPPPGSCPVGQHWNFISKQCVTDKPPPPPPDTGWKPPPGTPHLGQPDPQGDEITRDLCQQMADNTLALIYTMYQIQQQQGDGGNAACCADITAAIGALTTQVNNILTALSTGTPPPVINFDPTFAPAITINVPPGPPPEITVNAPGTDVQGIVDQLKAIVGQGDVDQTILDAMQQQGLISPADLQVLQGIKWSDVVGYVTGSTPVRTVEKWIKHAGGDADTVAHAIASFADPGVNFAEDLVGKGLTIQRNILWKLITPVLAKIKTSVTPAGVTRLGEIGVNPDQALADAAATMLSLKELAILIGLFREGAAEQLDHLGEKILAIIGLEEIREVQLGPLVRNGMAIVAEHQAKAIFRQEIPGATSLMGLVARGLLSSAEIKGLLDFNGLADVVRAPLTAAAYHGMNARQMLRLIETGLFSDAEISDELTFSGMRPVSQHRMISAAPYLATQPQRHTLQASYEKAHIAGLISDADLTANLDAAEHNTDRNDLIVRRVHVEELLEQTKAFETEYTELFVGGVWSDATFRANLAALGLQQWMIDLVAGKAEAKANVNLQRMTIREAAALERATAAEERKAAMEGFKAGRIDAAGLAAALFLTGLTPTQATAWVTLAELQRSGALRWIYGVLKSPAEAALLRERVAALADQRKRLQIDDPTFVAALQAMGLPARVINALRAATDALITPKSAAVTIPVQTS